METETEVANYPHRFMEDKNSLIFTLLSLTSLTIPCLYIDTLLLEPNKHMRGLCLATNVLCFTLYSHVCFLDVSGR